MADEIITKQELIDAKPDVKNLGEAANGNDTGIVTPRYGAPYSTAPAAIQKIESDGADALSRLESAKEEILTQVNNITTVNSINDLNTIEKWDGRTVYVKDFANFKYSSANNAWLLSVDSAQSVALKNGKTIQDMSYEQIQGTDTLRDTIVAGKLDVLTAYQDQSSQASINLNKKKLVIPNGVFGTGTWFYTRGIPNYYKEYSDFQISGNSDVSTIIKGLGNGRPRHIWADKTRRASYKNMHLDNMDQGLGTDSIRHDGQVQCFNIYDTNFENIRLSGGDLLSFVIGGGQNNFAKGIKVDFQYRFPVGYGKAPIIASDNANATIITDSYVRAVHPDQPSLIYDGDLAGNDQANDSKWGFTNLFGLTRSEKASRAACMWQEGENGVSNAHFVALNYLNNGIGHGVSEKSIGTDIGCTVRKSQFRGIWNRNVYYGIGNHFFDCTAENPASGLPSYTNSAINIDNASVTVSIGSYFSGNTYDVADYTGGATTGAERSFMSIGDRFDGLIALGGANTSTRHFSLSSCVLSNNAKLEMDSGTTHVVLHSTLFVGSVGRIGGWRLGETKANITCCTFVADNTTNTMLIHHGGNPIYIKDSRIQDYNAGIITLSSQGTAYKTVFRNCDFVKCTFLSTDLANAVFIDCNFYNCTNAPAVVGLNFKCDSDVRPSSIRTEVTLAAGASYTFPAWTHEQRGVYDINVGGRGENTAVYKGYAHKASAASAATIVNTLESTVGAISVTWAANGYIKITVTTAGTYSIKLG